MRIESLRPEKLDPGTTVKGMEYIDVPANSKKDYKLSFYAYKEGQTVVKVGLQILITSVCFQLLEIKCVGLLSPRILSF